MQNAQQLVWIHKSPHLARIEDDGLFVQTDVSVHEWFILIGTCPQKKGRFIGATIRVAAATDVAVVGRQVAVAD